MCNCETCNRGGEIRALKEKLGTSNESVNQLFVIIERMELELANATTDAGMSEMRMRKMRDFLGDEGFRTLYALSDSKDWPIHEETYKKRLLTLIIPKIYNNHDIANKMKDCMESLTNFYCHKGPAVAPHTGA